MHSAWNSCPHGRLITLLWPSSYSSKHTTHSICFPAYFFFGAEERDFLARWLGEGLGIASSPADILSVSSIPEVVRERGLGWDNAGWWLVSRSGDAGEEAFGETKRDDVDVEEQDIV